MILVEEVVVEATRFDGQTQTGIRLTAEHIGQSFELTTDVETAKAVAAMLKQEAAYEQAHQTRQQVQPIHTQPPQQEPDPTPEQIARVMAKQRAEARAAAESQMTRPAPIPFGAPDDGFGNGQI